MDEYLCINVDSILIDMGDHNVRYKRGDSVDGIPAGTLDALIRRQMVVPKSEVEPTFNEIEKAEEPMNDEPTEVAGLEPDEIQEPDWLSTPISALGLSSGITNALERAGLKTAKDILVYGRNDPDGTLTSIRGIGLTAENKIKVAVEKIAG